MHPSLRFVLVLLIAMPALLLGWHGNQLLKSEILLGDAKKLLASGSVSYAYEKASESVRRNPASSGYQRYQFLSAYRQGKYKLALEHARGNLESSPADAKNWLRVAQVKARLRQFDVEFNNAFKNAFNYAKHSDDHQLRLARLGVLTLERLDTEAQAKLGESVAYILKHQYRYRFIAFLFNEERESLVCPVYAVTDELSKWCDRTAKLRSLCRRRAENRELAVWCAQRGIGSVQ